ncbi:MAG: methionyl-tRNA formyltransferase [Alphaproteobacteria bacterium]|nr:methionyl-tRNA formyltransferase [Alphaproteobacteria bacterium]
MTKLRLVFMGTPDFAVPALKALVAAGHDVVAAYCQPPKPAGRGQTVHKTPVHLVAETLGIGVLTPRSLRDQTAQQELAALKPEVIVVAAYGLILPQAVLDIPPMGCLNIHGSLLPRWRGAAPIHRAILAGDVETGITIMKMEAGLDTGPMLLTGKLPITSETTAQLLHDAMADLGARLIVEALDCLTQGQLEAVAQPEEGVTYAAKLTREEGLIDWTQSAAMIERQVRALNPWPSAFFNWNGETIKVLQAELVSGQKGSAGGMLLDERFTVACGQEAVRLVLVQRAGKKPTDGASFLRGARLPVGTVLA